MKNRFPTFSRFLAASTAFFVVAHTMRAASGTWDGSESQNWQDSLNWSVSPFPGSNTDVYGSAETATFSTTGSGSINLGDLINIQNINFGSGTGNANAFIIGDANDTLNLTSGGVALIGTGVTTSQQIGVTGTAIRLSTAANSTYSFTNNSSTPLAKLNIAGGITTAAASGTSILSLTGTNGGTVSGNIADGNTANLGVTKTGTGAWTLSGANTYTGGTNINGGTLVIGATNTLLTTGNLTMNSSGSGTTPATLDLSNFSQTINNLTVNNRASTSANEDLITIGNGQSLAANGSNITFGSDGGSRSFTRITGAGTFSVNNAGGTFLVGGSNTGNTQHAATLDMSGLAFFNAALGTGTFRIGGLGSSTNAAASTVRLAATSSITATTIDVGGRAAHPNDIQTLKLGSNYNTLNAATINIGGAPDANVSRASGELSFNTGTGELSVRGLAGEDTRANLNVANSNSNTGSTITGLFDVTGHTADIRLGTVNIGQRNNINSTSGATVGTVSFDTGTLDATAISMGKRINSNSTNPNGITATLNIGGGTANIGSISMSQNTGTIGIGTGIVTSTLNFTGGVITLAGDITQVSTIQATGTLNLNGATLDMGGNNIGGATAVTNLNFQSGTLKNVAQINNGAGLTKTTGGTLIIDGINTYTGATLVSAGTLLVAGSLGNTPVTVDALGIIGGDGTLAGSLEMISGSKFVFSSTQTLTVNGTVLFGTGFGVDDLTGLDSSVDVGTYTLIDGTSTDFSTAGLDNFGSENAYDLGGGKSAYFQNGSLQLVVIPEPGVISFLGALGVLALLRRRR